jgi:hypothetical protein
MPIRDIIARMRHNGCGGRAGKVELLTGIEGASSQRFFSCSIATIRYYAEMSGQAHADDRPRIHAMERVMQSTQQLPRHSNYLASIGELTADALAHRRRCRSLPP